ncbi:MAG TPA: hypothetical protein V6D47_11335 [Oscillatoriaceae cyanobacterium]
MPTKELWFMPKGGPGRQYVLDFEPVEVENAAKALSLKMYRKFAAGEVGAEPEHAIVLAVSTLAYNQIRRGSTDEQIEDFLLKTAERAASCLDMRLPPPIEPEVPKGFVLWLSSGDFASEKALTITLVKAIG